MGWFSKKEDKKLSKEFDSSLDNINTLAIEFRVLHAKSMAAFEDNFKREKSDADFEQERLVFEKQFDVLQKLKFHTDLLIEEGLKIIRNESVLTEQDRLAMRETEAKPKKAPVKKKTAKPKKKTSKPAKKKATVKVKKKPKKAVKKAKKPAKKKKAAKKPKKGKKKTKVKKKPTKKKKTTKKPKKKK